jgi:hypothetical protein
MPLGKRKKLIPELVDVDAVFFDRPVIAKLFPDGHHDGFQAALGG